MKSLFERLEALCEGAIAVDRDANISWMNDKYARRFGLASATEAVGRPIEDVIPGSRMPEVVRTGAPIVLDIMVLAGQHCVVTRMPLVDEAGVLVGAVGFVLYDRVEGLKPLLDKVAQLQVRLTAAERELSESRRARYSLAAFLGVSAAAAEVKRLARRAASQDATVLLTGETGTGKELLAHAIHNLSPRAERPFVGVNAAAIPEALLEAELFGAAAGAYTGADRRGRDGKFKLADGGTLFLDEVGDMPLPLQAKLLRVLQEREIEPLGANRLLRIDVRVIAATSVDLAARVADGRFRADLYYRLNVLELAVPPLRSRLEDLPVLAEHILDDIGARTGQPLELDDDALLPLLRHRWPGNVRELRNVLERAVMVGEGSRLSAQQVMRALPAGPAPGREAEAPSSGEVASLRRVIADAERGAIQAALAATGGNKLAAAQALGISRAAFYQKLAQLGLG
ncbi:sigma 54-interacting transcriptional regulator [Pelomonas sp. P7]|uniref:Sigma 54-interacting transcriptional regulator n=2 Tax=Sphaerotilaceae TaxID=2975441 RepID=A0ABS8XGV4_9BURK|nr:sigma 54-interacting transcriptional regulator [Pelomonas sp. P7]